MSYKSGPHLKATQFSLCAFVISALDKSLLQSHICKWLTIYYHHGVFVCLLANSCHNINSSIRDAVDETRNNFSLRKTKGYFYGFISNTDAILFCYIQPGMRSTTPSYITLINLNQKDTCLHSFILVYVNW